MSTLREMFAKMKIPLYQNESLDLDHYYQEPFQDMEEENPDQYDMATPFESITAKQKRTISFSREGMSNFCFFMDGSRRTYKIGDIVLENSKIFPVVVAQVRAGFRSLNVTISFVSIIEFIPLPSFREEGV